MNRIDLESRISSLRSIRRFNEAYKLACDEAIRQPSLRGIAWENQPIFWSDIQAGVCRLTRRNGNDAPFIETLWRDHEFAYSFHRHAMVFPRQTERLAKVLEQEFVSTIGLSKALLWIVRDRNYNPWGILSLVEISLIHRRAEVMLGVLRNAPLGLSAASMLILFQFFFKAMKFRKLYSFVYEDNPKSLKSTLHLGFAIEGRLRKHILDPRSGNHLDLIQTGLLAEEAFTPKTERLMRRLLGS